MARALGLRSGFAAYLALCLAGIELGCSSPAASLDDTRRDDTPSARAEPADARLPATSPPSEPPQTAPPSPSSSSAEAAAPHVSFDFENAGLPELARAVSLLTGRRILLTGKLPDVKATVYSPDPVRPEDAYDAFLAILHANGLTLERHGAFEVVVTEGSLLGR